MPPWSNPLGSLTGGRTLETMLVARGGYSHFHGVLGVVNQGDKIYRFDESGERVSAKPESLADANSYLSFLSSKAAPRG